METGTKIGFGVVGSAIAYFSPIHSLILTALVFVGVDFLTGVWACHVRHKKKGKKNYFNVDKAWKTVTKMFFMAVGIYLMWRIDTVILADLINLHLAKLFAGFTCGIELLSILRNMGEVTDHPVFRWSRKFVASKLSDALGTDIEEIMETKEEGAV